LAYGIVDLFAINIFVGAFVDLVLNRLTSNGTFLAGWCVYLRHQMAADLAAVVEAARIEAAKRRQERRAKLDAGQLKHEATTSSVVDSVAETGRIAVGDPANTAGSPTSSNPLDAVSLRVSDLMERRTDFDNLVNAAPFGASGAGTRWGRRPRVAHWCCGDASR
jgi:hypothetical protein